MKLFKININNFKCFQKTSIELADINCIIGENSSGKTKLFEVLEITLGRKKGRLNKNNTNNDRLPFTIVLEFIALNSYEKQLFEAYTKDGRLTLKWKGTLCEEEASKLQIMIVSQQPAEELLRPWTLVEKKWKHINKNQLLKRFYGRRLADYAKSNLDLEWIPKPQWEDMAIRFIKDNADRIRWVRFESYVPQHLFAIVPFFYQLPPVYYFENILKTDDRADPISRGISSSLAEANEKLKEHVHSAISKFLCDYKLGDLEEIENIIQATSAFHELKIEPRLWIEEKIKTNINLSLDIFDGIKSDLQLKGHGLQRLVLYGQMLATIKQQERDRQRQNKPPRNYIIGIDEIELYLHPNYQSIMLKQLRELSASGQFQIVYTSHSPSMIDVFNLESVTRLSMSKGYSKSYQVKYADIAKKINTILVKNTATDITVRERIGEVLDIETCCSLFSKQVIVVEGSTEQYAFPELFKAMGFDFERSGMAIVSAGGKGNIDKIIFLMEEFGIPCFSIFDQDLPNSKQSDNLRKLLGITSKVITNYEVGEKYCVFERDFEDTLCRLYPGWMNLDAKAKQIIGAKKNSAKGLRAKYISRYISKLIRIKDQSVTNLCEFLDLLYTAIVRRT